MDNCHQAPLEALQQTHLPVLDEGGHSQSAGPEPTKAVHARGSLGTVEEILFSFLHAQASQRFASMSECLQPGWPYHIVQVAFWGSQLHAQLSQV